jgi:guanylate kinase
MTRRNAAERAATPASAAEAAGGLLVVLSGPSGVGKDAMLKRVLPTVSGLRRSISVTTRPPRPGEQEGREYFFRSDQEFDRMQAAGELLESAQYLDHRYGTPKAWVEEQRRNGASVVLEIDVQGALQVRRLYPDAILVFVVPPSWEALASRLAQRHTETAPNLEKRLEAAQRELKALPRYDYVIVNDNLERAADQLECILQAERCRPGRVDLAALGDPDGA